MVLLLPLLVEEPGLELPVEYIRVLDSEEFVPLEISELFEFEYTVAVRGRVFIVVDVPIDVGREPVFEFALV